MSSDRIIVFTRYPTPGTTKTRLIPALGPEGAAALQREMTEYVISVANNRDEIFPVDVEVRFEGGHSALMEAWLGSDLSYVPQGDGDLGERMCRAFTDSFESDCWRTILVGSDCPQLTSEALRTAFLRLTETDAVIGPASDGGYYLIGLRRPKFGCMYRRLFHGPAWGSKTVYRTTLELMQKFNLSVSLLPVLSDVDEPEDLNLWYAVRRQRRVS